MNVTVEEKRSSMVKMKTRRGGRGNNRIKREDEPYGCQRKKKKKRNRKRGKEMEEGGGHRSFHFFFFAM
jgi:peptide subunit release factor 1 (eRF1)